MPEYVVWKDANGEKHAEPYTTADEAEDTVNGATNFAFPVKADSASDAIDKVFGDTTVVQRGVEIEQGKGCPFCNGTFLNLEKGSKVCNMTCILCGAKGPTAPYTGDPMEDFRAAVTAWNKRHEAV